MDPRSVYTPRLLVPCNDDIGHSVPQVRRTTRVPLPHLMSQLHVGLIALVLLVGLGELLGDDELANVHAIAEQIGDDLFRVLDRALLVAVNQQLLKARVNEVGHQGTVVATDSLNAWGREGE